MTQANASHWLTQTIDAVADLVPELSRLPEAELDVRLAVMADQFVALMVEDGMAREVAITSTTLLMSYVIRTISAHRAQSRANMPTASVVH